MHLWPIKSNPKEVFRVYISTYNFTLFTCVPKQFPSLFFFPNYLNMREILYATFSGGKRNLKLTYWLLDDFWFKIWIKKIEELRRENPPNTHSIWNDLCIMKRRFFSRPTIGKYFRLILSQHTKYVSLHHFMHLFVPFLYCSRPSHLFPMLTGRFSVKCPLLLYCHRWSTLSFSPTP